MEREQPDGNAHVQQRYELLYVDIDYVPVRRAGSQSESESPANPANALPPFFGPAATLANDLGLDAATVDHPPVLADFDVAAGLACCVPRLLTLTSALAPLMRSASSSSSSNQKRGPPALLA